MQRSLELGFIGMYEAHLKNGTSIRLPKKWPKNQPADLLIPTTKFVFHPDAYLVFSEDLPGQVAWETESIELIRLPHGTRKRFISFINQLQSGACSKFWWVGGAPSMHFQLWSQERWEVLNDTSDFPLEDLKL